MNVIPHEQGTDAWMAWRRSRRMASLAPAVMKASAHQSERDVIAFYRDGKRFAGNAATEYGHAHEAQARAVAAEILGEFLTPVCVESGEYGASLDGISFDEKRVAECKCPYRGKESPMWEQAARYGSAGGYVWQVRHQMMVSDAERALFVVWTPEQSLHLWIDRDEGKEAELRTAWDALWARIAEGKPAERDDGAWLDAVNEYRSAKLRAEREDSALASARERLLSLIPEGIDEQRGAGLMVQRIVRKGSVDYAKVPELAGIDLAPYRKADVTSWTIKESSNG